MKSLLALALSLLSTLVGGFRAIVRPVVNSTLVNQVIIEPLALFEKTKIYASVNSTATAPVTLVIMIKNSEGEHVACSNQFVRTRTGTFTYDNSYTVDGENEITVLAKNKKTQETIGSKVVDVRKSNLITLNEDKTYKSEARSVIFKNGETIKYENETIHFGGFDDFYMPDYYHKFDPALFTFEVKSSSKVFFDIDTATFIISNRHGVFNSLLSNQSYAQLDLILVKDTTTKWHLAFKDKLFVNPRTLEMSSYMKTGYVETKYLFLPINEMRYQEEYECGISITGLGLQKSKIIHYFALNAMLNTMGDCHNSEYCIVTR